MKYITDLDTAIRYLQQSGWTKPEIESLGKDSVINRANEAFQDHEDQILFNTKAHVS